MDKQYPLGKETTVIPFCDPILTLDPLDVMFDYFGTLSNTHFQVLKKRLKMKKRRGERWRLHIFLNDKEQYFTIQHKKSEQTE